MAGFKLKVSTRLLKKKSRKNSFMAAKNCRFCNDKRDEMIDYKNVMLLRDYLTERYKILPSRVSGNCNFHQRTLSRHIKLARSMALLPYCAIHL